MGSMARSRQLFLVGVAIAVLAVTHRLTMPVEPVTFEATIAPESAGPSHTPLRAPIPARPGRVDSPHGPLTGGTSSGERRGSPRGAPLARDLRLRISVPAFVRDHLMTPATQTIVDERGRAVSWSFAEETRAAEALVAGTIDARVSVGRRRRRRTTTRTVLLGDFVAVAAVHPENPVRALTKAQLSALLSGFTSAWNRFGGRSRPVQIYALEPGSDSFGPVIARRLGLRALTPHARGRRTLEQVAQSLVRDPTGIAVLPRRLSDAHGLIALKLDRFDAPTGKAGSLAYPLTIPVVLVTTARSQLDAEFASRLAATLRNIVTPERSTPRTRKAALQVLKPRLTGGRRRGW